MSVNVLIESERQECHRGLLLIFTLIFVAKSVCCAVCSSMGVLWNKSCRMSTVCVIVFHWHRLCPCHKMKKPIKDLWIWPVLLLLLLMRQGVVYIKGIQGSLKMAMTSSTLPYKSTQATHTQSQSGVILWSQSTKYSK